MNSYANKSYKIQSIDSQMRQIEAQSPKQAISTLNRSFTLQDLAITVEPLNKSISNSTADLFENSDINTDSKTNKSQENKDCDEARTNSKTSESEKTGQMPASTSIFSSLFDSQEVEQKQDHIMVDQITNIINDLGLDSDNEEEQDLTSNNFSQSRLFQWSNTITEDQNQQVIIKQGNDDVIHCSQKSNDSSFEETLIVQEMCSGLTQQEQQFIMKLNFECFNESGCQIIENMIDSAIARQEPESTFLECLIQQLLPIMSQVMDKTAYRNSLAQKIILVSNADQVSLIVNSIINDVVNISLDIFGTRTIQVIYERLAQLIKEDQKNDIINSGISHYTLEYLILTLSKSSLQLIQDMNGSHVMQCAIKTFRATNWPQEADEEGSDLTCQYTQFVFNACIEDTVKIANDRHGCCLMQRCLEHGTRVQKLQLADAIIENIDILIEDPFGNYLIQNVLKIEDESKNEAILQQIAKDFIRLSQLKFSSNVIEVCFQSKYALSAKGQSPIDKLFKGEFPEDDKQLVQKLGKKTQKSQSLRARVHFIVQNLIFNMFGNFVIQKSLTIISDEGLKNEILHKIKSLTPQLMEQQHGKKVLSKLQRSYPHIFGKANINNQYKKQGSNIKNDKKQTQKPSIKTQQNGFNQPIQGFNGASIDQKSQATSLTLQSQPFKPEFLKSKPFFPTNTRFEPYQQ